MPRFFTSPENVSDDTVKIVGDDARHIARSLRMAVGDRLTVSDGAGNVYETELTHIRDELCEATIIKKAVSSTESPAHITLYMAYPKSDKLETIIQKSVELGVLRIVPFESSRCIKNPPKEKAEKKTERLSRIAKEAAQQCGRSVIPTVSDVVDFDSVIADAVNYDLSLFCYEGDGATSLKSVLSDCKAGMSVCVIVGSEGGFSKEEADAAKAAGLKIVNLGPRILRCETAPNYVLAAISYVLEL